MVAGMTSVILSRLAELEAECGFRVLLAVESGSRAWGFASGDSDWDVRFVFAWPRDAYLSVLAPGSTHQRMEGLLDFSGWDVRMALGQFAKSNASLLEWVGSPCVYARDEAFHQALLALLPACFRTRAVMHHYLGLARSLQEKAGDEARPNGKKWLYVLRATLAAQWTLTRREAPPVAFARLMEQVTEPSLRGEIDALLAAKGAGSEADAFPVSAALRAFVDGRRTALDEAVAALPGEPPVDMAGLDDLFRRTLEGGPR